MSGQKDRSKIEQIIGECFVKAAAVILGSRIHEERSHPAATSTSKRKWVSVEVLKSLMTLCLDLALCCETQSVNCLQHSFIWEFKNRQYFDLLVAFKLCAEIWCIHSLQMEAFKLGTGGASVWYLGIPCNIPNDPSSVRSVCSWFTSVIVFHQTLCLICTIPPSCKVISASGDAAATGLLYLPLSSSCLCLDFMASLDHDRVFCMTRFIEDCAELDIIHWKYLPLVEQTLIYCIHNPKVKVSELPRSLSPKGT